MLAAAGALLATALTAGPASAHDRLTGSSPAPGERLSAAPAQVELTFSSEVLAVNPQVVVQDAAGTALAGVAPVVDGARVTAALPAGLAGGTYTVLWRVVSGDGHPVEGTFAFDVDAPAASAPAPAPPASASPEPSESSSSSPAAPATPSATSSPAAAAPGAAEDDGGSGPVLAIGGVVAALAGAGGVLLALRRRDPNGPPGQH